MFFPISPKALALSVCSPRGHSWWHDFNGHIFSTTLDHQSSLQHNAHLPCIREPATQIACRLCPFQIIAAPRSSTFITSWNTQVFCNIRSLRHYTSYTPLLQCPVLPALCCYIAGISTTFSPDQCICNRLACMIRIDVPLLKARLITRLMSIRIVDSLRIIFHAVPRNRLQSLALVVPNINDFVTTLPPFWSFYSPKLSSVCGPALTSPDPLYPNYPSPRQNAIQTTSKLAQSCYNYLCRSIPC